MLKLSQRQAYLSKLRDRIFRPAPNPRVRAVTPPEWAERA